MSEEPERVELETPNLAARRLERFDELFPGVVADGVLDANRLGELLDTAVTATSDGAERFGLTWAGKSEAVRSLMKRGSGALAPDSDRSIGFDAAANVFIEGDNLEVLKLLQKAYNDRVKLVYIDPPYNTTNDFVYSDDFQDGLRNYLEYSGQLNSEGNRVSASAETEGRRHSHWLSMMYPRMVLARNLLTQDGLIMVHIDEHEAFRLGLLLDEVFGPENNLGEIVWDKRNPKGDATGISTQHEYILVYARSREVFAAGPGFRSPKASAEEILTMAARMWGSVGSKQVPADLLEALQRHGVSESVVEHLAKRVAPEDARRQFASWLRRQPFSGGELAYNRLDDNGEVYRLVSMAWPNKKQAPDDYFIPLVHPVTGRDCPVPARGWRNPPATMRRLLDDGLIVFGSDETTQPQRKYLLRENMTMSVASILAYGGSDDALLAEMGVPFDTPKPVSLIRALVAACTSQSDTILDFFAGSGSTAHAVALQNDMDGGARRSISVNVPEPVRPGSEAERSGFKVVSDITLRRLEVMGELLESPRRLGLRVFRLRAGAFIDPRVEAVGELFDARESTLLEPVDLNAVAAEILLNEGVPLDVPWHRMTAGDSSVVAAGGVAVALCREIDAETVQAVLGLGARVVVFLEDGFAGADAVKANAVTNARNLGITMKTA